MDLNSRIIGAVRECPLLYGTRATIAQRQRSWKQLAEQIGVQEQFLKSRWHFLREQYRRQDNGAYFKYKEEMNFIQPYIRRVPKITTDEQSPEHGGMPEFVITEKDIENDSDNEEYVFMEVEALESNIEEEEHKVEVTAQLDEQQLRKQLEEQETVEERIEVVRDQEQKKPNEQGTETGRKQTKVISKSTKIRMRIAKQQEQQRLEQQEQRRLEKQEKRRLKQKEEQRLEQQEQQRLEQQEQQRLEQQEQQQLEKQRLEEKQRQNTEQSAHTNQHDMSNAKKGGTESNARCEDDIFGELVAAMLKRMSSDKKRAVKKDIMNLLLT